MVHGEEAPSVWASGVSILGAGPLYAPLSPSAAVLIGLKSTPATFERSAERQVRVVAAEARLRGDTALHAAFTRIGEPSCVAVEEG